MSDGIELLNQLRTTLGKMEIALNSVNDAIVWVDGTAGRIQWGNQAFCRLLGKNYIELLGTALTDLLPLKQADPSLSSAEHPVQLLLKGKPSLSGLYYLNASGQTVMLEISGSRAQLSQTAVSIVLIIRNVTDREQVVEALKRQKEAVEQMNRFMVDREQRMIELKREVNGLLQELRRPREYEM